MMREHIDLITSMLEADDRGIVDKLTAMMVHPGTPDAERRAAAARLAAVMSGRGTARSAQDLERLLDAIAPDEEARRRAVERFVQGYGGNGEAQPAGIPAEIQRAVRAYSRYAR